MGKLNAKLIPPAEMNKTRIMWSTIPVSLFYHRCQSNAWLPRQRRQIGPEQQESGKGITVLPQFAIAMRTKSIFYEGKSRPIAAISLTLTATNSTSDATLLGICNLLDGGVMDIGRG